MYIFSDNVYRLFLMFAGSKFNIFYRTWLSIIYFSRIGVDDIHYSNIWNESKCLQLVCKNSNHSKNSIFGRSSNLLIILFFEFWSKRENMMKLGSPYVHRSLCILRFGRWIRLMGEILYIMLFWKSIFKERCIKRS